MKIRNYLAVMLISITGSSISAMIKDPSTLIEKKKVTAPVKDVAYHPVALKVGDKAPDFEGTNSEGEKIKLSDFKGKKVVIYFYPKTNTYGCNAQAFSFRDNAGAYKRNNIEVLGVSYDTPEFQNQFKIDNALPFTLVSDESKEISKKYATYQPNNDIVPARVTFLIDENGTIFAIMKENAKNPDDRIVVTTHAHDVLKRFGFKNEQLRPF